MSFLGRLFGSSPPPPDPHSVVIAADLAETLTASGTPLSSAVDAALRGHLEAERRAAEAEMRGEKIPFWLRREQGASAEMEDMLRDRIAQRRAGDDTAQS
jgi:head-tail adaptor